MVEYVYKTINSEGKAHIHSRSELEKAWNSGTPENVKAKRRKGKECVVIDCCDKEEALRMSAAFHKIDANETSVSYDGSTISFYCGAHSHPTYLMSRVRAIPMLLSANYDFDGFPLFEEDL